MLHKIQTSLSKSDRGRSSSQVVYLSRLRFKHSNHCLPKEALGDVVRVIFLYSHPTNKSMKKYIGIRYRKGKRRMNEVQKDGDRKENIHKMKKSEKKNV